jgi:hypothetical protein
VNIKRENKTKIIYWTIKGRTQGGMFMIRFWSKPDESNALSFNTISINEDVIRRNVEDLTGSKRFILTFIRED